VDFVVRPPGTGFCSIITFAQDVQDELRRLDEADCFAMQDGLRVEIYDEAGAARIVRKILVDRVRALRQPGALSKRPPRKAMTKRAAVDRHASDGAGFVDVSA
jgi:hypothetical protein